MASQLLLGRLLHICSTILTLIIHKMLMLAFSFKTNLPIFMNSAVITPQVKFVSHSK